MSIMDRTTIPQSFDQKTGLGIGDQAKLILAGMLPGCTARRYDFPPGPDDYWEVQLCFADHGPILPQLSLSYGKYFASVSIDVDFVSMLKAASGRVITFPRMYIPGYARLDSGAAAVATTLYQAIAKVDLAGMIAAGTIERIFADYRSPAPWPCFYLAQCAVYLGRYDEARALLQDSLKYAEEDGRPNYRGVMIAAEIYLVKLNADPDALRRELNATVDYNWSHLKVIGAA